MNESENTQQNLKKKFADIVITTLFPMLLISERQWLSSWKQQENKALLVSSRIYFSVFFVIYIAHSIFVDVPANKEPLWLWVSYRGGCAALHLIGFLLTFSNEFMKSDFKRVPIYFVTAVCVYMQGKSMEWLATVPPFYVPVLAAIGVLALRLSIAASVLSLIVILMPSYKFYFVRPNETHHMVSATLVSMAALAILRSRQKQDVQVFIAEQMRLSMQKQLIESQKIEVELSKKRYYLAAQIAHDIRSPLATLSVIVHKSDGVEESIRSQIKDVVARIRDIANSLLKSDSIQDGEISRNKTPDRRSYGLSDETSEVQHISQRLSAIVSEKRLQFANQDGIAINLDEVGLDFPFFVNLQSIEFGRVLSNLIDNAVHAVKAGGKVRVAIKGDDAEIQIVVEDDGVGISPDGLNKIGIRGYSHGRDGSDSGMGLGVYHAMETVKSWGGNLKYESEISKGTKAIITLPRAKCPEWFVESISIAPTSTVVVLDDDPTTHKVWIDRFQSAGLNSVRIIRFSSSHELIHWYRENVGEIENTLYLIDYKIAERNLTGLDVIEMLGIGESSILVTDSWNDCEVRQICEKLKVKILPKIVEVPIECSEKIEVQ